MLLVALRHELEELFCPCRRGRYADPLDAGDKPVPFHSAEPGQDVVVRGIEVFSEFAGCGKANGYAAGRETDGYLPVFFEENPDSCIDYLVVFMYGHLIVGVALHVREEKRGWFGYAASAFISPRSSSGISSR